MKAKKVKFIVNPISGGKDKSSIGELIHSELGRADLEIHISFSEYAGHAQELTALALAAQYDVIVAVGGDGTINEVASLLVGTSVEFGIVPFGSGNGLARALGIPLNTRKAIQLISSGQSIKIDSAILNEKKFFNMAGVGFDAKISHAFASSKSRGLKNYIKIAFNELMRWKGIDFVIEIDGVFYTEKAYMISIANSSQYGNDMHIAHAATVQDGLLDVCIIRPFPKWTLPYLGFLMYFRWLKEGKWLKIIKGRNVKIVQHGQHYVHVDGEPMQGDGTIHIQINPSSINIIAPNL